MAYGYLDTPSAATYPPQTTGEARRVGTWMNTVGAVLSVALIGGVGLWSYRLMVRDVSGVPVIRALDGPMRVSPADPGGRQAAYQGLAVNSVAADGTTGAVPSQVALAPQSTDLAPEDRTRAAAAPQAAPMPAAVATQVAMQAPVAPMPQMSVQIADALLPADVPGLNRSPMPPARPSRAGGTALPVASTQVAVFQSTSAGDRAAEAALQEIATRLSAPRSLDIDPTSLTAGTRLVQLGAFETESEARRAWDDLMARFPAYLDGRGRVVEAATAGGRVFYRLRAHGFRDEPEARRFCSVFVAEDIDCTPVLIR
jgi:hypothetical protein